MARLVEIINDEHVGHAVLHHLVASTPHCGQGGHRVLCRGHLLTFRATCEQTSRQHGGPLWSPRMGSARLSHYSTASEGRSRAGGRGRRSNAETRTNGAALYRARIAGNAGNVGWRAIALASM